SGLSSGFDLSVRGAREDNFGVRFRTCVTVPTAGLWTFVTRSDDGSMLRVDGALVVGNDGLHATQERSGSVTLSSVPTELLVDYFELGGDQTLEVLWSGPGVALSPIPASVMGE